MPGAAPHGQLPAMSDIDRGPDRLQDLLSALPPERKGVNGVELGGCVAAVSAMNPTGKCDPAGDHEA